MMNTIKCIYRHNNPDTKSGHNSMHDKPIQEQSLIFTAEGDNVQTFWEQLYKKAGAL